MSAPVRVIHTHVHAIRLASGAEALVARVLTRDGGAGYGFSIGMDAAVARDMAAWDAHAKSIVAPLYRLLGGKDGQSVPVTRDGEAVLEPDWDRLRRAMLEKRDRLLRIDPFVCGSLDMVQSIAAGAAATGIPLALLAPNGYAWELAWCAALAGASGSVIVRGDPATKSISRRDAPGIGVDWALEPEFGAIRWVEPA